MNSNVLFRTMLETVLVKNQFPLISQFEKISANLQKTFILYYEFLLPQVWGDRSHSSVYLHAYRRFRVPINGIRRLSVEVLTVLQVHLCMQSHRERHIVNFAHRAPIGWVSRIDIDIILYLANLCTDITIEIHNVCFFISSFKVSLIVWSIAYQVMWRHFQLFKITIQ